MNISIIFLSNFVCFCRFYSVFVGLLEEPPAVSADFQMLRISEKGVSSVISWDKSNFRFAS